MLFLYGQISHFSICLFNSYVSDLPLSSIFLPCVYRYLIFWSVLTYIFTIHTHTHLKNLDHNFLIYALNLWMYLTFSLCVRHLYLVLQIYFESRVKIQFRKKLFLLFKILSCKNWRKCLTCITGEKLTVLTNFYIL